MAGNNGSSREGVIVTSANLKSKRKPDPTVVNQRPSSRRSSSEAARRKPRLATTTSTTQLDPYTTITTTATTTTMAATQQPPSKAPARARGAEPQGRSGRKGSGALRIENPGTKNSRARSRNPKGKMPRVAPAPASSKTPDFITQTDRYGNASTPRSSTAISSARVTHPSGPKPLLHVENGKLTEQQQKDDPASQFEACAETLMDSLRIMCCCWNEEKGNGATTALVTKKKPEDEDGHTDATDDDTPKLLPRVAPQDVGKKCLVLDLDETLVHSSFRAVPGADFVIPVQIEDVVHFVYVAKRPGVDDFLVEMAKHYEIVIYTASLNKYADPLLDLLDPHKTIRHRLFRESCVYFEGNYVKDLSLLNRDLSQTIIVDNSPSSYIFHPENAIDCSSFIDDQRDVELDQIGVFLSDVRNVPDVRTVCHQWKQWPNPKRNKWGSAIQHPPSQQQQQQQRAQ